MLVPGCKSKLLSQEGAWRLKKMQYDSFANNYNPKLVDCWVLVIKSLEVMGSLWFTSQGKKKKVEWNRNLMWYLSDHCVFTHFLALEGNWNKGFHLFSGLKQLERILMVSNINVDK